MVVRSRHVEAVNTTILLGVMVGTPHVFLAILSDGGAFLPDLPFRAASLGGLGSTIRGFRFPFTTLLGVTTAESHALGQFTYLHFDFLKGKEARATILVSFSLVLIRVPS